MNPQDTSDHFVDAFRYSLLFIKKTPWYKKPLIIIGILLLLGIGAKLAVLLFKL